MKNSAKMFKGRNNMSPIIGKQLEVKIAYHGYRNGLVSLGEVDEAEFALGRQLNK